MIPGVKLEIKLTIGININIGIHLSPEHLDLKFLTNQEKLVWITGAKWVIPWYKPKETYLKTVQ